MAFFTAVYIFKFKSEVCGKAYHPDGVEWFHALLAATETGVHEVDLFLHCIYLKKWLM